MGTPAASGPQSGYTTPRRQHDASAHTGLTPAAKRPPARTMVPEASNTPVMSLDRITNMIMTLGQRREADNTWLSEIYESICRHADDIDKISKYVLESRTKSENDMLGIAIKARADTDEAHAQVKILTQETFHQVDSELDRIKKVVDEMSEVNIGDMRFVYKFLYHYDLSIR